MEHLINERVKQIQISGIRKMANLVSTHQGVVSLTIGQPDFPTPDHIIAAGKLALDRHKTVYTANAGLLELREAAARFVDVKYGLVYNPHDEVIVTAGASEALDITLRTIVGEGCEVILPGPIYPGYDALIRLCGAIPVYVDTTADDFVLSAQSLAAHLTERTRCVIMCYPSNPTGRVMSMEQLSEIAALLADKDIFIISDEIYSELIYGQRHCSIASIPQVRNKTIVINGLSKSHSMTGWRIGFTFAPAYLSNHMIKVHQYNVTCASSISQQAALAALTEGIDDAEPMKREYERRRDFVYNRLVQLGFDVVKPEGAFYMFPSVKRFNLSSWEFTIRLLEQQKVAVVPGDAFSALGEGYIRISYAYSMDQLEDAMNRVERFVQSL